MWLQRSLLHTHCFPLRCNNFLLIYPLTPLSLTLFCKFSPSTFCSHLLAVLQSSAWTVSRKINFKKNGPRCLGRWAELDCKSTRISLVIYYDWFSDMHVLTWKDALVKAEENYLKQNGNVYDQELLELDALEGKNQKAWNGNL